MENVKAISLLWKGDYNTKSGPEANDNIQA
jgi:hypothetical protein